MWIKLNCWNDLEIDDLIKIELLSSTNKDDNIYVDITNGVEFIKPYHCTYIGFFKGVVIENSIKLESIFLNSNNSIKYEGHITIHMERFAQVYKFIK